MNSWLWIPLAVGSAACAALVAVLAKLGLKGIDTSLATALRAAVMFAFLLTFVAATGKLGGVSEVSGRDWLWIALAGVAGALSWLLYFWALKIGKVSQVAPIDRLSMVFAVALAMLVLGEHVGLKTGLGVLLMAAGAVLISLG